MRLAPDPDDPTPPAAPGVRPFLQGSAPTKYRPPAKAEGSQPAAAQPQGENTTTLRPFIITAGRVAGIDPSIGMETQVTTVATAVPSRLSPEKRAIVILCTEPHSVAEISARLKMHLGVTRILVGDLRAAGLLDVHMLENDSPDPETIMRVIRGLRTVF